MHQCYSWEGDEYGPFFYVDELNKALANEREAHPEYEFSRGENSCYMEGEEYEAEAYWMVRKLRK